MRSNAFSRWGGLAGVLGGIIFVLVFVLVGVFVGLDPAEPEGLVIRFPDIRAARTVEDGLYLVVLVLWVAHFLALYRALRATSLASALFGSVLGILGLGVLAAGALPHVVMVRLSDLYHAAVAGDPGHLRCAARRWTRPRAVRSHRPRDGHAQGTGLRQGLKHDERGARGR